MVEQHNSSSPRAEYPPENIKRLRARLLETVSVHARATIFAELAKAHWELGEITQARQLAAKADEISPGVCEQEFLAELSLRAPTSRKIGTWFAVAALAIVAVILLISAC